jgi:excisionase family DNA binding protein
LASSSSIPITAEPPADPYLNADEAAALTRYTARHLRILAQRGEIPHIRIGRTIRFRRVDLDRWMAAHLVGAR